MNNTEVYTQEGLVSLAHRVSAKLVYERLFDESSAGGRGVEQEFALVVDREWPGYKQRPRARVLYIFAPCMGGWVWVPSPGFVGLVEAVEEMVEQEMTEMLEAS